MAIPISYNLRNLIVRKTTTIMTALGIGAYGRGAAVRSRSGRRSADRVQSDRATRTTFWSRAKARHRNSSAVFRVQFFRT